eukprot:640829-Pleurochrysis_carterae.AAC.1
MDDLVKRLNARALAAAQLTDAERQEADANEQDGKLQDASLYWLNRTTRLYDSWVDAFTRPEREK